MSKKILLVLTMLFLWTVPATSQERCSDTTTYVFRFVPEDDMFYVPWSGNDAELERLLKCIEHHRTEIIDGRLPLYVDGFCNSQGSESANLAMAKIRANRVKSELIIRAGVKEENFITRNHATDGDRVVVRLTVPAQEAAVSDSEAEAQRRAEAERLAAEERAEQEPLAEEQPTVEYANRAAEQTEAERAPHEKATVRAEQQGTPAVSPSQPPTPVDYHLSVRANLLRWATLTPDIGLEWRIGARWSLGVNAAWTSWTWNNKERRYALWEVAPAVRYYLGEQKAWYVGAMFKAGQFNYKLSDMGRQGDLVGGGITGGYQLWLNKALALDFNLGLGCLNADYEKYEVIDGVRVRRGTENSNWWGPIDAGVTLVWRLF